MKKILIYIIAIFMSVILIVGGTYAFFVATSNSNQIVTNSTKFEVIYTGGKQIGGKLEFSNSKTEDFKTAVNIRMAEGSVLGIANLYIQIDEITSNIANEALTWEVYKTYDGVESFEGSGSFADCQTGTNKRNCETGDKLYIVDDYKLSEKNTTFTIYIWLNGNLANNSAIGGIFKGYIGAETENFTGDLG